MGKSDLLKDGMKSTLTGCFHQPKNPRRKRNGSGKGGKGTGGALQLRH